MHATFEYYCGIKIRELKHYQQRTAKAEIAEREVCQTSSNIAPQDSQDRRFLTSLMPHFNELVAALNSSSGCNNRRLPRTAVLMVTSAIGDVKLNGKDQIWGNQVPIVQQASSNPKNVFQPVQLLEDGD